MPITPASKLHIFCPCATLNALVAHSLGSEMFREWFIETEDGLRDIARGSSPISVIYVSALLSICGLLPGVYTDVETLLVALKDNDWKRCRLNSLKAIVAVVVWGSEPGNQHVGFNTPGSDIYVSLPPSLPINNPVVSYHGPTLDDGREILEKWTHPRLCRAMPQMARRRSRKG